MLTCTLDSSIWNGRPTLAVTVVNEGSETAPGVGVFWEAGYDSPQQPAADEWAALGGREAGFGVSFVLPDGETRTDVPPGGRATFYLHPLALDGVVLSHIAALSPDRLSVVARSAGRELGRFNGKDFSHLFPVG